MVVSLLSCNENKNEKTKTVLIASYTLPCQAGELATDCMQVKWSKDQKDWEHLYSPIEGFEYEKGYNYELLIKEDNVVNPPADASSIKYTLLKIVSKEKK
jgi:hypothetical protein